MNNTAAAHALSPQPANNAELSQIFERTPNCATASRLPKAVHEIVELCDGRRSVEAVCEAARISEDKGLAVVRKLTSLGILRVRRPPRRSGFTELEEAFFASEVAPIDECDLPFESVGQKLRSAVSSLLTGIPTRA